MKKPSQTNRSALLIAGEKSLHSIEQESRNYYTMNNQLKYNQQLQRSNQVLYESNVRQVYKRPGYQGEMMQSQQNMSYKNSDNKPLIPTQYRSPNSPYQNKINNRSLEQYQHFKTQQIEPYQNYELSSQQNMKMKTQEKYHNDSSKIQTTNKKSYLLQKIDNERIKKIMMKLTFTRLRKIQALVRGFLVRRKVYPKLLQEYLIAKSVLSLIQANVVYRQISTIIMQTITFPKYDDQQQFTELYQGRQKMLQQMLYQSILSRVIQKEMKPIIEDSITKRALLVNRPQITFGFNLRDPLELLLYEKLMELMAVQLRKVCQQSIKDQALERRELFIIDEWIEKYNLLQPLFEQIANQLLEQNIGQYVVDDILQRVIRQAAFVVSESGYNNEVNDWYMKTVEGIKQHLQDAVIEDAFSSALIQLGYGIQQFHQKENLL